MEGEEWREVTNVRRRPSWAAWRKYCWYTQFISALEKQRHVGLLGVIWGASLVYTVSSGKARATR